MKRSLVAILFSLIVAGGAAGCAPGNVLHLPGDLSRPSGREGAPETGARRVVVLDFSDSMAESREIGRDYHNVRAIVWKGSPGRQVADLVAAVLAERGVPAVRVPGEAAVPPDAAAVIRGRVEAFRVDAKKAGLFKVENVARVVLSVSGSGPGGAAPWSGTVASDYTFTDAVFVTPEGVYEAMNGAVNAVVEEAVRRLAEANVVQLPSPPPAGGGGKERVR